MPSQIDDLLSRIAALEQELEERIEAGCGRFDHEMRAAQRRWRQSIPRFLSQSELPALVTAPVIYSLIVPIALLDAWVSLYHAICFRAYGIPLVRRSAYIVIDRQHLAYLNGIEKLNCVFCGYGNGVFAYVREVAGRTEQYWCPIRHAKRVRTPHAHYRQFVDYGDAEAYRKRLIPLRQELRRELKKD
jgi:hypothetical protein